MPLYAVRDGVWGFWLTNCKQADRLTEQDLLCIGTWNLGSHGHLEENNGDLYLDLLLKLNGQWRLKMFSTISRSSSSSPNLYQLLFSVYFALLGDYFLLACRWFLLLQFICFNLHFACFVGDFIFVGNIFFSFSFFSFGFLVVYRLLI